MLHSVELLRGLPEQFLAISEWHAFGHDLVRIPKTRVRQRGPVHRKVAFEYAPVRPKLLDHVEVPRPHPLRHLGRGRGDRAAAPVGPRDRHREAAHLDHHVRALGELGDADFPLGKHLVPRLHLLSGDARPACVWDDGGPAVVEADPGIREGFGQSDEAGDLLVVQPGIERKVVLREERESRPEVDVVVRVPPRSFDNREDLWKYLGGHPWHVPFEPGDRTPHPPNEVELAQLDQVRLDRRPMLQVGGGVHHLADLSLVLLAVLGYRSDLPERRHGGVAALAHRRHIQQVEGLLVQSPCHVVSSHIRQQILWQVADELDLFARFELGSVGMGVLRVHNGVS
eukprot:m.133895 g.133895  ORF g.133895 m.133895 type:complete len:341 (+) comp22505_c0_seq1:194-1216(+)